MSDLNNRIEKIRAKFNAAFRPSPKKNPPNRREISIKIRNGGGFGWNDMSNRYLPISLRDDPRFHGTFYDDPETRDEDEYTNKLNDSIRFDDIANDLLGSISPSEFQKLGDAIAEIKEFHALAWYDSFHFSYPNQPDSWGITLHADRILGRVDRLKKDGLNLSHALIATMDSILDHEYFHHSADMFALKEEETQIECLDAGWIVQSQLTPTYLNYRDKVVSPNRHTEDNIEEALATASEVRDMDPVYRKVWDHTIAQSLPTAYENYDQYLGEAKFRLGRTFLASRISDGDTNVRPSSYRWNYRVRQSGGQVPKFIIGSPKSVNIIDSLLSTWYPEIARFSRCLESYNLRRWKKPGRNKHPWRIVSNDSKNSNNIPLKIKDGRVSGYIYEEIEEKFGVSRTDFKNCIRSGF